MLTVLGPRQTPADVIDSLLECHARIRSFAALAVRLGGARAPSRSEIAGAAAQLQRYFVQALPLHVRDEEESLLPRLRGREAQVDRALEAMSEEHVEHTAGIARLISCAAELARDPGRHAALAPDLFELATELERRLEAHLSGEESIVFPAARRLLSPAELGEISAELKKRRNWSGGDPGGYSRPERPFSSTART